MRDLEPVWETTARVRVTAQGPPASQHDVTDGASLRRLREALAVTGVVDGFCMCWGEVEFTFLDRGGRSVAVARLHHGTSLSEPDDSGDALLRDPGALARWLADHGISTPQPVADRGRAEQERWLAAAPDVVRDLLNVAVNATSTTGIIPEGTYRLVGQRLVAAFPDPADRAAALLAWYGSGSGRYSGYPVHEALPRPALEAIAIDDIIAALQARPQDGPVTTGAARHLCDYHGRTAEELAVIPAELRARLLAAAGDDFQDRAAQLLAISPDPRRTPGKSPRRRR